MEKENYSEELKVRLSPTQLQALEKVARTKQSKPGTQARLAIHEMLLREDDEYRFYCEGSSSPDPSSASDGGNIVYVDFYEDRLAAGVATGFAAGSTPTKIQVPPGWTLPVDFVAPVSGDSMKGVIEDGELAAFIKMAHSKRAPDGEVVAAFVHGVMMIKTFERFGGVAYLTSANAEYDPIECDDHVVIQGLFQGKFPKG